jgi:hypothetical protein
VASLAPPASILRKPWQVKQKTLDTTKLIQYYEINLFQKIKQVVKIRDSLPI